MHNAETGSTAAADVFFIVQECGGPEGCAEERREMEFFIGINEPLARIKGRLEGGIVV
jgi:hypothetical protein